MTTGGKARHMLKFIREWLKTTFIRGGGKLEGILKIFIRGYKAAQSLELRGMEVRGIVDSKYPSDQHKPTLGYSSTALA